MTTAEVFQGDRGAMAVGSFVWIAVLALAAVQAWAGRAPAPAEPEAAKPEAAETKEKAEAVQPVPDDVQLIAALDPEVKESRRDLAVWPSADEVSRKKAQEDRSEKIPDDAKRAGAVAPEKAMKEAERWIRTVLKAEWVPSDLAARLHALAEEDAAHSAVWCRYRIKGQAIQIGQSRGVMCVVIRPDKPKGEGETATDFGQRCLKEFLAKGEELAQIPMEAVTLTAPELSMFSGHSRTRDDRKEWWGDMTWYADGQAVAVFLGKKKGQFGFGPDTPWF